MRVVIIESNTEWALELAGMVDRLGYVVAGVTNSLSQAGELLKIQSIDLIISDVSVKDESAVEFLQRMPGSRCPVLFATTCTDELIYELAGEQKDTRYLVRPFHALTLHSAIESVVRKPAAPGGKKGIIVRSPNNQRVLVAFDTIYYVRVEKNYCFLFAQNKKYALKISLAKLVQQLDERFIQIHKGFCINGDHITRTDLSGSQIFVNDTAMPIGYRYRKKLVDFLARKAN